MDEDLNRQLLNLAIANQKAIVFRYCKDGDRSERRRVIPSSIFDNSDGLGVFTGLDLDRVEDRSFRLDRIDGLVHIA